MWKNIRYVCSNSLHVSICLQAQYYSRLMHVYGQYSYRQDTNVSDKSIISQKALIQYRSINNHQNVYSALLA